LGNNLDLINFLELETCLKVRRSKTKKKARIDPCLSKSPQPLDKLESDQIENKELLKQDLTASSPRIHECGDGRRKISLIFSELLQVCLLQVALKYVYLGAGAAVASYLGESKLGFAK